MNSLLFFIYIRLRILIDVVIDYFFSLYWEEKNISVPDLEKRHGILTLSAVELARKIRNKQLKSEELTGAVIDRIKQVNPIVNAITHDRFEAALEDARRVDKLIAEGLSDEEAKKKPLLGVPFTCKESNAVEGFPLTNGLWSRKHVRASEDSDTIIMMKQAGAIFLATTNMPEMLIWQETMNNVYGLTKNPHHTGRTVGGSSGGEAALTATFATPISLCSDIGGSTRMPAFYCGMFGHHPTAGVTTTKGVFLRKEFFKDSIFCLGFISKHAEDLAPLTQIINVDKRLKLDQEVNIKDIQYFYLDSANDFLLSPIQPEMTRAFENVVSRISREVPADNRPRAYKHNGFNHMYKLWCYAMSKEPDDYERLYHNGEYKANALVELVKKVIGLSQHCFFCIIRLLEFQILDKLWPLEPYKEKLEDLKNDLFSKLGDKGVLLLPSAPIAAPYHYSTLIRPYNFSYFAVVNALKCPATQVPLGKNSQGLPMGIQVLAAPYNDMLCISVAKFLEKEFGGAVMACKVTK